MTDSRHPPNRVSTINVHEHLAAVLCVLLCAAFSIPKVMSTLAPYDDEGYVMLTLQSFQNGDSLYSQIHTQYGPVFYYLSGWLHEYAQVPLSQDGVRWKTVAIWSLCSLLCFYVLRRLGLRTEWACVGAAVFHLHLDKLALEPGHPQEWVLLLGLLSLWTLCGDSPWRWHMAAVYVAFIGLIKINCGVLFAVPLLLSAFLANENSVSTRHEDGSWISRFFRSQSNGAFMAVMFVGMGTSLVMLLIVRATGVAWQDIAWGLVGQHQRFGNTFFHLPPIGPWAIGGSMLCMFLVVLSIRTGSSQESAQVTGRIVISGIVFIGGVLLATDVLRPLQHGLEPRGASSWLVCALPAVSLLSWRYLRNSNAAASYLHGLAWFAPCMAYPTPGTQLSIGTSFVWIHALLVAKELYRPLENQKRNVARISVYSPVVWGGVGLLVLASVMQWKEWAHSTPLRADGASWLRLDRSLAERESRLVEAIKKTGCRRLAFDGHSHGRFYFWSGLKPLTSANPTFWPRMLTSDEQSRWMDAMQREPVCVVLPPERELLAGGLCQTLRDSLTEGWVEMENIDGWQVGIRYPVTDENSRPEDQSSAAVLVRRADN